MASTISYSKDLICWVNWNSLWHWPSYLVSYRSN